MRVNAVKARRRRLTLKHRPLCRRSSLAASPSSPTSLWAFAEITPRRCALPPSPPARQSLRSHEEDSRPATRLFVQWLDANGLSTPNCTDADWLFLPAECTHESQARFTAAVTTSRSALLALSSSACGDGETEDADASSFHHFSSPRRNALHYLGPAHLRPASAWLTTTSYSSQIFLDIEDDWQVPETTGEEDAKACVRRFRQAGLIASGVCAGDNGFPSRLAEPDRQLVRVAMYGAQVGRARGAFERERTMRRVHPCCCVCK